MKPAETAVRTATVNVNAPILPVPFISPFDFPVPPVRDILLDCKMVEHIEYVGAKPLPLEPYVVPSERVEALVPRQDGVLLYFLSVLASPSFCKERRKALI